MRKSYSHKNGGSTFQLWVLDTQRAQLNLGGARCALHHTLRCHTHLPCFRGLWAWFPRPHMQPELPAAKLHTALVSCQHHALFATSLAFLLMLRNQAPRELLEVPAVTTQKLRMHVPRDQSVTNEEGSWANVSPSLFLSPTPNNPYWQCHSLKGKSQITSPSTLSPPKTTSVVYLCLWSPDRRRRWHPTPALLIGKSHGRRSLVGCSPWGRTESDTTEAT